MEASSPRSRVVVAATGIAFAVLLAMQRAPSQAENASGSLTLAKHDYLSTEAVSASLVIANTTSSGLAYNPLSVRTNSATQRLSVRRSLRDSAEGPTKGLLSVRLRATFAFNGESLAAGRVAWPATPDSLAFLGATTRFLRLPSRAIVAADRPEIYAVGVTMRQASDRLGLQASAIASALAAARIRALAEQFGVTAGAPSLIAIYPEFDSSPQDSTPQAPAPISTSKTRRSSLRPAPRWIPSAHR